MWSAALSRTRREQVLEAGDALFQERTIEMDETREEAVVSKEARVTEELVVRKDVDQRTAPHRGKTPGLLGVAERPLPA
jgi:stress response protein YsnF